DRDELPKNDVVDALVDYGVNHGLPQEDAEHLVREGLAGRKALNGKRKSNGTGHHEKMGQGPSLDVVCMADVQAKAIDWLWEHRFAIGKVSVLAGEGGQGKSTVLCDIAARVTTGERWPDGADNGTSGSVIFLTSEDDPEDTLKPRLIAAGADVNRVFIIR